MRLALCTRPDRADAVAAVTDTQTLLRRRGHDVAAVNLGSNALADELAGTALVCVFGGDGTMLRAARAVAPLGLPLLGVNLGRLGFLTRVATAELPGVLEDVGAGRYECEERALLGSELVRHDTRGPRGTALNDVVVARGGEVRSVHLDVRIDGERFTVYWADGLVISTATGSTAYAMSAGGPLMLPSSRAMLVVPIAPHLSFANALVLEPDQRVSITVQEDHARLSIDGQDERDLRAGDRVEIHRAEHCARFVRTPTMRPFLELLRAKILKEGVLPVG